MPDICNRRQIWTAGLIRLSITWCRLIVVVFFLLRKTLNLAVSIAKLIFTGGKSGATFNYSFVYKSDGFQGRR